MKKALIVVLLLIGSTSYTQIISNEAMLFNNLPKKINELKRTSLSIEVADKNLKSANSIGSGFLMIKNNVHYAVTNYHVVNNVPANKILIVGMNYEMKKQYSTVEQVYSDQKHDIAVLKIGIIFSLINNLKIDSTLFKPSAVGISLFEKSTNIHEGEGVILIGYPLGLGSEFTGNQPISRIGIVAQAPHGSMNTFFIDGIASHGNSGSPVFNAQNMKLLGMIIGFPSDYIAAYDENKQLIAKLPYNSGLSLCATADIIMKTIP